MAKDFLPTQDAKLLAWANNYCDLLTATPDTFGVTAAQCTALAAVVSTFETNLAVATNPTTRTRAAVEGKTAAKRPMTQMIRDLARIINAFPGITNQQRIELGLNPRKDVITPIHAPTESPILEVVVAMGRLLRLRLHAQDTTRRGKPENVKGATIMSFVGSAPPADITLWKFEGSTTKTIFDLEFPATVPAGAQVFLTAFWFSPTAQSGPACAPISAFIAGGVTAAQQQQAA